MWRFGKKKKRGANLTPVLCRRQNRVYNTCPLLPDPDRCPFWSDCRLLYPTITDTGNTRHRT
jgi:hypothetical protein